jgi:hypothetical protein
MLEIVHRLIASHQAYERQLIAIPSSSQVCNWILHLALQDLIVVFSLHSTTSESHPEISQIVDFILFLLW